MPNEEEEKYIGSEESEEEAEKAAKKEAKRIEREQLRAARKEKFDAFKADVKDRYAKYRERSAQEAAEYKAETEIEKKNSLYASEVEKAAKEDKKAAKSNLDEVTSLVSCRHLTKIYSNRAEAVHDFNLEIKEGEFIVLVGPSGCGKSTTLRMIAGLEDITYGDLYINGKYVNDAPPKERYISMVFQSYALYPHMSVYENIRFPISAMKIDAPKTDAKIIYNRRIKGILAEHLDEVIAEINAAGHVGKIDKDKAIKNLMAHFRIVNSMAKKIFSYGLHKLSGSDLDHKVADIITGLDLHESRKMAYYDARGIKLNEKFEILDKDGNPVIENRHLTDDEIDERIQEAGELLEITPYLDRKPTALSGGQCQRVALGRAIARKSPIFLLDEPLSNLDAKLRVQMRSELIKLHKRLKNTMIYVTHDQTEAMTMADRIVIMRKGIVMQCGSPREVYERPANVFVATFIGSPTMNIMEADFEKGHIDLGDGNRIELTAEEQKDILAYYERNVVELSERLAALEEEKAQREEMAQQKQVLGTLPAHYEEESKKLEEEIAAAQEIIQKKAGKIFFGIRPEDVTVDEKGSIKAIAELSELLGAEYYLHAIVGDEKIVAKIPAGEYKEVRGEIKLNFAKGKEHLFDYLSGERIL